MIRISKENRWAMVMSLVYAFVLLFLLSPDSYIRDLWCRSDSATFFMCGKAWMNGMIPYVDFVDSKGPLLWLIYGIGYLLSHHSYVGVFWISIVFYAVTLFMAYKLCRLYADRNVSMVATALLPAFLFFWKFHYEVRSEDFCYPLIMISLYCICRILKYRDSSERAYLWLSAVVGACAMCVILIKYNYGAAMMSLMAVVLYMSIRHRRFKKSFVGMAAGFIIPALPFIICFLIYGNLGAFIHEYFLATFHTIENGNDSLGASLPLGIKLKLIIRKLTLLILLGVIFFCYRYKAGYWLVGCHACFMLMVAMGNSFSYYASIFFPISILLILSIVDIILPKVKALHRRPILCSIVCVAGVLAVDLPPVNRTYSQSEVTRQDFYTVEYIMSQVKNPKILCSGIDFGNGITVNSLPACRHWIYQIGATEEMKTMRRQAFRDGVADFVILDGKGANDIDEVSVLANGYVFYYKAGDRSLYGRPGLRLPPADFHVSQWDVWLKRNIFGI